MIANLLSPDREGAAVYNVTCAFICGMALARQKYVLMLQEGENVSQPIDYRDIIKPYSSADEVVYWLEPLQGEVLSRLQSSPKVQKE